MMNRSNTLFVAAFLALSLSAVAQAQVVTSFRWFNSTAGSLVNVQGLEIGAGDATILTFLTADPNLNPVALRDNLLSLENWVNVAAALGEPAYVSPNLMSGRFLSEWMTEEQPNDFAADLYAWALILDMPAASFTSISALDLTVHFDVHGSLLSPQIENLDTVPEGSPQNFTGFSVQTSMPIPEPGTMAIALMGVAVLVVRRSHLSSCRVGKVESSRPFRRCG